MRYSQFAVAAFIAFFILLPSSFGQSSPAFKEDVLNGLEYRHVGPIGNRVSAVTGVAGDPLVYYAGAASGGIFKSIDGGVHWKPVFDDQPAASIGSLAVSPSDPNVVWAGTGEAFIRSNISIGNGIYLSQDAGKTWKNMGLQDSGRIGRVVIHPTNPEIVFAAALGHCYGPQEDRGVYRTTDGGKSWKRVLFVDPDTGASDLVMDPNNPRILFAGMWPMLIRPWGRQSGGGAGGLFMSRDGGDTWEKLEGKGLPKPPTGKIALAMSAANSERIYALIETNVNRDFAELDEHQGVLWRSDDGGESWKMVNASHNILQRPHYYGRFAVLPDDYNELHFMSVRHSLSIDGGLTTENAGSGWDHHDIWIDPLIPNRMIVGHDGGISISNTRGKSWYRPQLPIAQMYHAFTDDRIPYFVYGNRQDGSSYRVPSNTLTGDEIPIGEWHGVGGCESGFAIPVPKSTLVWSGCYDGILDLYDLATGHSRNVSIWPDAVESVAAADLKYRFQWTFPISLSPHDPGRVYVGSQFVHVTDDNGQSWRVISADLTGNDKTRQTKSGGLTPDDAGPTVAPTVFAIAESRREKDHIWAGTNDGRLHLSRDGGQSWKDLTANLPGLPEWAAITKIEPSRFADGKCFVSADAHQMGIPEPFLFRTSNYGETWERITAGIPNSPLSYTHCVTEDPVRPGLLYAGTENALYVSFDDGDNWLTLQLNLPHAPVHWIEVQEHFNDLVVATYGRGFWILDDITFLQSMDPASLGGQAHLFGPRPAYRFRQVEGRTGIPEDPAAGENPEYGATIHFYLPEAPGPGLKVEISDSQDRIIRTLTTQGEDGAGKLKASAGLNRITWNLRTDPSPKIKLLTPPDEHGHVKVGEKGFREMAESSRGSSPLVPPGTYRIRLSSGGDEPPLVHEFQVLKDPNSSGTLQDIQAQQELIEPLQRMIATAAHRINTAESVRLQLEEFKSRLPEGGQRTDLSARIEALQDDLEAFEDEYFDLRLTGPGQDTLRWPRRFYAKLLNLVRLIQQSDHKPTDQHREVYEVYRETNAALEIRWRTLADRIVGLNDQLVAAGAAGVQIP